MNDEQTSRDQQQPQPNQQQPNQQPPQQAQPPAAAGNRQGADGPASQQHAPDDFDGLEGKKADELTPEELRWMADTMPGEGPGD